jgi:hypothetical protein
MQADVELYPTSSCTQVDKQVRTARNRCDFRDLMESVISADPAASIDLVLPIRCREFADWGSSYVEHGLVTTDLLEFDCILGIRCTVCAPMKSATDRVVMTCNDFRMTCDNLRRQETMR